MKRTVVATRKRNSKEIKITEVVARQTKGYEVDDRTPAANQRGLESVIIAASNKANAIGETRTPLQIAVDAQLKAQSFDTVKCEDEDTVSEKHKRYYIRDRRHEHRDGMEYKNLDTAKKVLKALTKTSPKTGKYLYIYHYTPTWKQLESDRKHRANVFRFEMQTPTRAHDYFKKQKQKERLPDISAAEESEVLEKQQSIAMASSRRNARLGIANFPDPFEVDNKDDEDALHRFMAQPPVNSVKDRIAIAKADYPIY